MAESATLKRRDVPAESTWDPSPLFASWTAWQEEVAAVEASLPALATFAGRLVSGAATLADWLDQSSEMRRRVHRLRLYAYMHTIVDSTDVEAKGRLGQAMGLVARYAATAAFAEPEILALGAVLPGWIEAEPRLAIYEHYFNDLSRQQAHRRSAEVEEILGMLADPFSTVFRTYRELTDGELNCRDAIDSRGLSHAVRQTTLPPTGIQSRDRTRRRSAWQNFCDGHSRLQNTLASNYLTQVKQAVFSARARGYASVLESKLDPYHIPVSVFHNLLATFTENLPTWHRYWDVRRRALGYTTIHPYDIWAPLGRAETRVRFEQAVDWLAAALQPLGTDYVDVLRRGCLEERWVDWAPNTEKSQGAQSLSGKGTHPYLWLSYDESVNGASMLAHELGHAMHSYETEQMQPELYTNYSMTAAETASNFNQAMLRAYLVEEKADDAHFQLALIDEAMMNFHRYFFIMPTLARFELAVYTRAENGEPLSAPILNGLMSDLFAQGYGTTMVDDPARTATTWAQFLHLYMPYYTFQYAVGISAAHAIGRRIEAGSAGAADAYLRFLRAGNSLYAMEHFAQAGIDLASRAPVEQTFAVLGDLVDRLESLIDRI